MHVRSKNLEPYTVVTNNAEQAVQESPDLYEVTNDPLPGTYQNLDYVSNVPQSVKPLSMRRALRQVGMLASIEAAVAAADADTKDAWQYALSFDRDDALLNAMAQAMNLTDSQVDDIFRLAVTL